MKTRPLTNVVFSRARLERALQPGGELYPYPFRRTDFLAAYARWRRATGCSGSECDVRRFLEALHQQGLDHYRLNQGKKALGSILGYSQLYGEGRGHRIIQ